MAVKGYVVRGKHDEETLYAFRYHRVLPPFTFMPVGATERWAHLGTALFDTLPKAIEAYITMAHLDDVRIYAVDKDGSETPLPTYQEALALVEALRKPGHTPRGDWGALSDGDRAAINLGSVILELLEGPCSVDDLCGAYPDTPAEGMAADLAILREAGVVRPFGPDGWELTGDADMTAKWEGCLPFARRLLAERKETAHAEGRFCGSLSCANERCIEAECATMPMGGWNATAPQEKGA